MTEMEQLHYNDLLTDVASMMEQVGARRWLMDFKDNYPGHFDELFAQISRLDSRPVPKLFQRDEGSGLA